MARYIGDGLDSIGSAGYSGLLAPQASIAQPGMSIDQFLRTYKPSPVSSRAGKALSALAEFAGYAGDPMDAQWRNQYETFYRNLANASPQHDGGSGEIIFQSAPEYDPAFVQALQGYQFAPTQDNERLGLNIMAPDGRSRVINWQDADSSFDKFAQKAIPMGIAALAGAAFGGFIPGAEIGAGGLGGGAGTITGGGGLTAGGSAGYGSIGGTLGGTGGTTLGLAGGGMSAGAGLTSPLLQGLAAIAPASVLPSSFQSAGSLLAEAPVSAAAPPNAAFNAAADSQAMNAAQGITGAEAAAVAKVPPTVNMGSLGGTMGTAGGLPGLLQTGGQIASDAIGAVKDVASPTWQFLKDNPTLGRLLLGGATSLLSSQGSGSSGASGAPSGPPVQWNSQLQKGLLAPVQQYAPAAIQQRPAGLLAQGNAGDGAWRFLRG